MKPNKLNNKTNNNRFMGSHLRMETREWDNFTFDA